MSDQGDDQLAKFAGYVAAGVVGLAIGAGAVYITKKNPKVARTLRHLAARGARELRRADRRDQVDQGDEEIRDADYTVKG